MHTDDSLVYTEAAKRFSRSLALVFLRIENVNSEFENIAGHVYSFQNLRGKYS